MPINSNYSPRATGFKTHVGIFCLAAGLVSSCATPPPEEASQEPTAQMAPRALCLRGREMIPVAPLECDSVDGLGDRITRALDRTPLEYATSELSLDLIEGIAVGAQYKYRADPGGSDGHFTRIDAYSFPRGASPGDLLDGIPLRIGLSGGSELMFAQQLATGAEARNPARAYLPQRIPLSAEKALALRTGDYVRFAARLNLLASVGQTWPAAALLDAGAELSVMLEGEYEVHLFRLDGDSVRLKLVAQRSREAEAGVSAEVSPRATALLLDRTSERLLPVARLADFDESAALAVSKSADDRFLLDYTLDLSRAEAAAAYDAVFQPTARFTDVRIANPLRERFDLRDRLLSIIEDLDRLAQRDAESAMPAVTRHFRGARYSTRRAGEFHVKLKSFDVTRERVFRENLLTRSEVTNTGERRSHFLLPMWSQLRDRTMLFGMLDETQVRTADALFVADEQGNPTRFMNIGFSLDYRDGRLRPSEYRALRQKIELLLPPEAEHQLAELLAGTPWLEELPRRDLSISLRYFFRETAFDQLVAAGYGNQQRLEDALVAFIVEGIAAQEYPFFEGDLTALTARYGSSVSTASSAAPAASPADVVRRVWRRDIENTAASLADAFTAGPDNERRMNAVLALRNDSFYQRVGTAFWADLLNRAQVDLTRAMFLSLEIDADDHPGISFTYGDPGERELYESVRFLQNVLNDPTFGDARPGNVDALLAGMRVVRY